MDVQGLILSLAAGIVHGLAGSPAIALLVLSTIHDPFWSAIYPGYSASEQRRDDANEHEHGRALTMTTALRSGRFEKLLVAGSGLLSFGFGIFIILRIGFWGPIVLA